MHLNVSYSIMHATRVRYFASQLNPLPPPHFFFSQMRNLISFFRTPLPQYQMVTTLQIIIVSPHHFSEIHYQIISIQFFIFPHNFNDIAHQVNVQLYIIQLWISDEVNIGSLIWVWGNNIDQGEADVNIIAVDLLGKIQYYKDQYWLISQVDNCFIIWLLCPFIR